MNRTCEGRSSSRRGVRREVAEGCRLDHGWSVGVAERSWCPIAHPVSGRARHRVASAQPIRRRGEVARTAVAGLVCVKALCRLRGAFSSLAWRAHGPGASSGRDEAVRIATRCVRGARVPTPLRSRQVAADAEPMRSDRFGRRGRSPSQRAAGWGCFARARNARAIRTASRPIDPPRLRLAQRRESASCGP